MRRPMLALVLVLTLAGCSGMKDLFSAHADVAAEAAGHTLSADSLASLLLEAKGARLAPETAEFLANLWVDYQLFGDAVVNGTLKTDSNAVQEILWPEITEALGSRWHDTLMARRTMFGPAAVDSAYAATDSTAVRVFQHILIRVAPTASVAERAAGQRKAAGLVARARGGDFGALARQLSDDQASRPQGGMMHAAPRGAYVTPFDSAGWTLRPGEVSGVVASPFGFHVIRRPPHAEVRQELQNYLEYSAGRRLDSLYMDSLGLAKHLTVKSSA
ncbi:MAG TPA: peptidylprolyl isomerase, partial [Gemmatimonadales bacterium]|nr:peptidylprolyl isomerase [Gemmatimonadales bacterium]